MRLHILSIFPKLFENFFSVSLIGKAVEKKIIEVEITDIRQFAEAPHYHVDDYPYGGGPGMIMKPEPLSAAIKYAKQRLPNARVILLSASGQKMTQQRAQELARETELLLICGRYEGVDQRVIDLYVDEELSIGDVIMMGGEVPAMALIESVCRLLPDVIGNSDSLTEESFSQRGDGLTLLEWPQYTRPEVFNGREVPEVLLSGDHGRIRAWRLEQALNKTLITRPDLIKKPC
ncbi:MAG: tRNA (guanosine(37)-N1)-methyltransferase TrmD [SAR324 cluster bacterium]|uniref:tRNA (guanine-N(1)-)-methyltransferase n=1 Tax=SAR324 cluster bacterium TaxID=2024889 RepID=A0A7X9IIX8_9DELT|nr:tRNA (guanosine(37)-N1)-methyltransferase TrmD [SAR324 cluster bacterium]